MKSNSIVTVWLSLACLLIPHSIRAQNASEPQPLDRPVAVSAIEDVTITEAIRELLVFNHIPGGMIENSDSTSRQPDTAKRYFNLSGLTVRQALNLVVSKDGDYRWMELNQGVVVYPVKGIPELLKTKVTHFEFDKPKQAPFVATEEILRLPEIEARMSQLNVKEQTLTVLTGGHMNWVKGKIVASNVNVYELLIELSKSASTFWKYSEHHCHGENTFGISWSSF